MTRRTLLTVLALLLSLAFTTATFAARAPAPPKPPADEYTYGADPLLATPIQPPTVAITGNRRSSISLLQIRSSFVPEIMKSGRGL